MSEIKQRAAKGFAWTLGSQFALQLVQTGTTIFLARLLVPRDFGLIGMAAIVTGFVSVINQFGLNSAVVQSKKLDRSHLDSTFWASNFIGLFVFLIVVLIAPRASNYFHEPAIKAILIVISLNFIFDSLTSVHQAVFTRRLQFKKLALITFLSTIATGVVSVVMAFKGYGVWSFVGGALAASVVQIIVYPIMWPWFPRLRFNYQKFKDIFHFGTMYTGNAIMNYVNSNLDYFFIGRILGSTSLGLYSLAYRLIMFPQRKVGAAINRVAFPAYSRVQDDNARLTRGYLSAVGYINFITFPFLIGLAIVAPEFVKVVYGAKWEPAIIPLQLLCFAGIMIQIAANTGSVLFAKGRIDLPFKLSIIRAIVLVTALFFFAKFGIIYVALIVDAVFFIYNLTILIIVQRLLASSLQAYWKRVRPIFLGSAIMALGVISIGHIFSNFSDAALLFTMFGVGITIYFGFFWLTNKNFVIDIWKVVKLILPKKNIWLMIKEKFSRTSAE